MGRSEAKFGSESEGEEGKKEEAESAVGHLDIGEGEGGEDESLEEVVAADAGHDAALAEGISGIVVELKHLGGGGEIEVVVVRSLIVLGVYGCGYADDEDNGREDQEERGEVGGP